MQDPHISRGLQSVLSSSVVLVHSGRQKRPLGCGVGQRLSCTRKTGSGKFCHHKACSMETFLKHSRLGKKKRKHAVAFYEIARKL